MKVSRHTDEIKNRQFFSVFLTTLFGNLGSLIAGFADGVLTGSFLGSDAMAAYGIVSPYFMLTTLLSLPFILSAQALCTAELGRGHEETAIKIFSFALWTSVILSAVVSLIGFAFAERFAVLLGANDSIPAVKAEAVRYLRNLFPGTAFFCFMSVAFAALQIDGASGLVKLSAALVGIVDVIGNLLNVFVFHGGLGGMGTATSVSYIVAALALLPYFMRRKALFSLEPGLYSLKYAGRVFSANYTETILWFLRIVSPVIVNRIILSYSGVTAMSAMSAQKNLLSLVSIVFYGLGDATIMELAMCYGESDRTSTEETLRCILKWMFVFTIPLELLMLLFSSQITGLYCDASDAELFRITTVAVVTLALTVPFTAAAKVYLRALQAAEKNRYAMLLNIMQVIVLPCSLTLLLCSIDGNTGAFAAYTVSELIAGVTGWLLYKTAMKQPDTFPIPEEKIFRGTAETPEQVVGLSEQISRFCRNNGCGKKLSYKLSLCAEEMGAAIIQEALYSDSSSSPFVSFIVLIDSGTVVMRLKDNCPDQNLRERALMWKPDGEQPERFIGIRMAMELASSFKYTRLLDVNNTVITFASQAEAELKNV